MSCVISIRVRRDIKKILEEEGINIGEEVRKFLEELAARVKLKRYVEKWSKLLESVTPSDKGFAARSVREDRESR